MATRQRLTRKDMRQDQFVSTMLKTRDYVEDNLTYFLAAIGGIVVVAIAVFLLVSSGQSKAHEAQAQFGKAAVEYRGGNFQLAIADFQTVVDNYGGTEAAGLSTYYIANAYFELKNYSEAQKYFQIYVDSYNTDPMINAGALAGLGHCLRAMGEPADAASEFHELVRKYPNSYLRKDALFYGSECYAEAGDNENAMALYEQFADVPGEAQRALQLKQLLIEKGAIDPAVGNYD